MSNLGDPKAYTKFKNVAIISMKNTSLNSLFFLTNNQSQNLDSSVYGQNRAACGSPRKRTIT